MARLDLGRADIALLANPSGTRVVIPSLAALSAPFSQEKAFVRFAGDRYPTAFYGEGRSASFALTCNFPRKLHTELDAFLTLLRDTAPAAADSRLLLRTHVGLAPGLNDAVAVEVDGDVVPSWTAPMVSVSLTVRVVENDLFA